ncbi:MAG: hypothetical protein LWY06_10810 [Firmicutes bacterium]|nr:hypothetical protein [Bacillota bacterium]
MNINGLTNLSKTLSASIFSSDSAGKPAGITNGKIEKLEQDLADLRGHIEQNPKDDPQISQLRKQMKANQTAFTASSFLSVAALAGALTGVVALIPALGVAAAFAGFGVFSSQKSRFLERQIADQSATNLINTRQMKEHEAELVNRIAEEKQKVTDQAAQIKEMAKAANPESEKEAGKVEDKGDKIIIGGVTVNKRKN